MEESSKWSRQQIMILIEAYKEEPCLYAVKSQNYHNKNLRAAALHRVMNAVRAVRKTVTEKECQQKIHNLRSQFNVENAKRKSSLKSGIGSGTDDAYIPSLWYYEHLMFLEEHFLPRKSKASPIGITLKNPIYQNIQHDSQDSQVYACKDENLNENNKLYVFVQGEESNTEISSPTLLNPSSTSLPLSIISTSLSATSTEPSLIKKTVGSLRSIPANIPVTVCSPAPSCSPLSSCSPAQSCSPLPSCSPAPSCSAASSLFPVFSNSQPPTSQESCTQKKRKRQSDNFQSYVGAIESIAESLRQPILSAPFATETKLDVVDSCMQFLGSMLKEIDCEKIKLEVMSSIVQTVFNAKTDYIRRTRNDMYLVSPWNSTNPIEMSFKMISNRYCSSRSMIPTLLLHTLQI